MENRELRHSIPAEVITLLISAQVLEFMQSIGNKIKRILDRLKIQTIIAVSVVIDT